jgi:alkyl sulfatase BDS1-like metallo-beta-lactamase superfamily hydrolase
VIKFHFTDVAEQFWVVIEPSGTSICLTDPGFDTDATISTEAPVLHRVWYGRETIAAAIKSKSLQFEGKKAITRRLPGLLSIDPATGLLGPGLDAPAPRIFRQNAPA